MDHQCRLKVIERMPLGREIFGTVLYLSHIGSWIILMELDQWLLGPLEVSYQRITFSTLACFSVWAILMWSILPPALGWRRAMPILKLRHVAESRDECVICRDVCKDPVQLECGHIECELCLRAYFEHYYERCPICFTQLCAAGSRWSVLYCKALVGAAGLTLSCCHHFFLVRSRLHGVAQIGDWAVLSIKAICHLFIYGIFLSFTESGRDWWTDVDVLRHPSRLSWPLCFLISGFYVWSRIADLISSSNNQIPL